MLSANQIEILMPRQTKNNVIPGFPRLYIRIDGEAIAGTNITNSEIAY
jgi:hypothetical protein